jgi:hypothetical protein
MALGGARHAQGRKLGHRCADLLGDVFFAFADQFGSEAHETAFLGGLRGGFGGADQPVPEGGCLLRCCLLVDDRANVAELVKDLVAGWCAAGGAIALDGVVVLLDLCLPDFERFAT